MSDGTLILVRHNVLGWFRAKDSIELLHDMQQNTAWCGSYDAAPDAHEFSNFHVWHPFLRDSETRDDFIIILDAVTLLQHR